MPRTKSTARSTTPHEVREDDVPIASAASKARKPAQVQQKEAAPDATEVVLVKKRGRKREDSHPDERVLPVAAASDGQTVVEKVAAPPAKKPKKTDTIVEDFVSDILPGLRREMKTRKKTQFDIRDYAEYFKPNSEFKGTYILPLFHFLRCNEIVCTRYGLYDGRNMIKTDAGFNRVVLLSQTVDLSSDERDYIAKRYGREWHKIPAKDGFKASAAHKIGFEGKFKICLLDIYEDEFRDSKTGDIIHTINPVLSFEPVKEPVAKKPRQPKEKKTDDYVHGSEWIDEKDTVNLAPGVYSLPLPLSPSLAQEEVQEYTEEHLDENDE